MRIAFIADAAQIQCRIQQRPIRRRRYRAIIPLIADNIVHLKSSLRYSSSTFFHKPESSTEETYSSYIDLFNSIKDSRNRLNVDQFPTCSLKSTPNRGNTKKWPLLTFWHLSSLILFIFSTTLALASSTTSKMNQDEDGAIWTPHTAFYDERREFESPLDEEDDYSDSCHRFDYFFSQPSFESSNLVRRSVDDSAAAKNSAVNDVFAVWLRASRYERTDENEDSETSWPLQRPRIRHRYRNAQSQRTSARKQPPPQSTAVSPPKPPRPPHSTAKPPQTPRTTPRKQTPPSTPRPRSYSTPRIRAVLKPSIRPSSKKLHQCKIFDESSADELCTLDVSKRVDALRHVYITINLASRLFSNESNTNIILRNVTLYELFALDINLDSQKSRPRVSHLSDITRPCVISSGISSTNSSRSCRGCYKNLFTRLKDIHSRYEIFSQSVLSMIDCEPDNDLEQFSPAHNCSGCKLWYKRWLLVIFSDIWRQKPCLQWCHLAELACPHLMPVRKNDYAGLPSFRCTDPEISSLTSGAISKYGPPCDCFHPCDVATYSTSWGWKIASEIPEFCRDYRKKEKIDCPNRRSKSSVLSSKATRTSNSSIGIWILLIWILLGNS